MGTDLAYPPSMIAAAAVLLSNKLLRHSEEWPKRMRKLTGYDSESLTLCAKAICVVLERASDDKTGAAANLKSVKAKYASGDFFAVSCVSFQDPVEITSWYAGGTNVAAAGG